MLLAEGTDNAAGTPRFGEGVLGPFEEGAEVKEECVSPFELVEDPMEQTRGDEVLDEYASEGCGSGSEGSLSLTYGRRGGVEAPQY